MRGGQNKKPKSLHVVEGTYRADRHKVRNQPRPRPVAPSCPRWLDKEAKKEWLRVASELEKVGLLTHLDRAALAIYCCVWSNFRTYSEIIRREGTVIEGHRGVPRKHPLLPALHRAADGVRVWSQEFGMTPSSRTRLSVTVPAEEDREFDKWLD